MDPTFRLAAASDLEVLERMMSEFHSEDSIAVDPHTARAALARLVANASLGQVWLVCDGDRPAGYGILTFGFSIEFGGRDAFVDELYIRPEFRRRGWGRRTIEALAERAREADVSAMHLEVTRGNDRALRLYQSVGYEEHNRYLMTRRLT